MNTIWTNRLIAGDKTWEQVPASRKAAIKTILRDRVASGEITKEQYAAITGAVYESV